LKYHEGVVEGSEDVSDSEDVLAVSHLWAELCVLLLFLFDLWSHLKGSPEGKKRRGSQLSDSENIGQFNSTEGMKRWEPVEVNSTEGRGRKEGKKRREPVEVNSTEGRGRKEGKGRREPVEVNSTEGKKRKE
jgi:hypothetical protein